MVFRRLLAAVAVSVLLIGLSSCRSDPTVAAYVGDDEISVDKVDSYYTKALSDPAGAAQVQQDPGAAKPTIVSMLVFIELLREAADAKGVTVTAGDVAAADRATCCVEALVVPRTADAVGPPASAAPSARDETSARIGNRDTDTPFELRLDDARSRW